MNYPLQIQNQRFNNKFQLTTLIVHNMASTRADRAPKSHPPKAKQEYHFKNWKDKNALCVLCQNLDKFTIIRRGHLYQTLSSIALSANANSRQVIIDCDPGTDDALAIFMLHQAHSDTTNPIHIEAITCVAGNSKIDNVTKNTQRILDVLGETTIPLYRGAEFSLINTTITEIPPYNGLDGFGDADFPPVEPVIQEESGACAIIRLLEEHPGRINVIALGPLTNLALAVKTNPKVARYPQELFILGGNHQSIGNVSTCGEFNFCFDPEAARIVLETFKCPITVLPLETWEHFGTSTHEFRMKQIGEIGSSKVQFMNKIEARILKRNLEHWDNPDSLLTAIFINPKIVTKMEHFYCTVELSGGFSRGMMVVDRKSHFKKKPNVNLITAVNLDEYLGMCLKAVAD